MRSLMLTASLLLACGTPAVPPNVVAPPPPASPDLATPQPSPVCAQSPGTVSKTTPAKGYWVSDGCAPGCLPPHQFFSICTTNAGVLLFDGTTEAQQYGATWETYLSPNPCAATPWRIWQLEQMPTPANPGAWADPSIESDCSKYPKRNTGPMPTGRFYYKAVAEIKKAVSQ